MLDEKKAEMCLFFWCIYEWKTAERTPGNISGGLKIERKRKVCSKIWQRNNEHEKKKNYVEKYNRGIK